MTITYLNGDATKPVGSGSKVICHIVNNQGAWGKGFALAVSARWKQPERSYRSLFACRCNGRSTALGCVDFINVDAEEGVWVANMIAQHGYGIKPGQPPPIRYEALATCLMKVSLFCATGVRPTSIHMPRIGCGLAGGTWDKVLPIIEDKLKFRNVFVYDYGKT